MKKDILVQELRKRQERLISKEILDKVSDNIIIESYMQCSKCGLMIMTGQELERFIVEVLTTDEFINLLPFKCGHIL
jgi:hypothetical protein